MRQQKAEFIDALLLLTADASPATEAMHGNDSQ